MKERIHEAFSSALAVVERYTDARDHERQMAMATSLASAALISEALMLVCEALDQIGNPDRPFSDGR
ncbi:MAG: hypothetical protein M0R22_13120 [Dehalococcoidia bacterium]|nr:hypothetical protein [Dehalococcoidia bacterium]